jgi:hypothetical protein
LRWREETRQAKEKREGEKQEEHRFEAMQEMQEEHGE